VPDPLSTASTSVQFALDLDQRATTSSINKIAWHRTTVDAAASILRDHHHDAQNYDLDQRVAVKSRQAVPNLLAELAAERGLAWSFIARLVGVSVAAVRKWRHEGGATPGSREQLARIAGFLDLLSELGVEDPAQWMEMRLPLGVGFNVTATDLYLKGAYAGLLDFASSRSSAEALMDEVDAAWRSARSAFETYDDHDGQKSTRLRSGN